METVSRYCTAESNLNDFQRDPRNLQRFAESEIAFALTHALTQLRLARGISLEDMAARVGRTPTYIARLEEGAYARCTVPALRTFARALGYDLDTNMSALFSEIPEALFAHDVGVEMVLDGILRAPSHEIAQPADAVPSAERLDELVQAYESNEVIGAVVSDAVKGGVVVAQTSTDNYGDFKFDRLDENSGDYVVEISVAGRAKKIVTAKLGASINLGEIRL